MSYKFIDEKKQHLHTLNEKPLIGTSTVCGVLAKPLTWWASGMAVGMLGWLNSKLFSAKDRLERAKTALETIKEMDAENFLDLLDRAYKAHSIKLEDSADAGIDMHSELERFVRHCIETNEGKPDIKDFSRFQGCGEQVCAFHKWSVENVVRFILSEAHVFSERMWTGGQFDILFLMKDKKLILGDFKSAKEAYLSHFIQIAGYDIQLGENGAYDKDGKTLLDLTDEILAKKNVDGYVVFPFGGKKFEPSFRYNTEELRKGFESALVLYKLSN